MKQDAKGSFGGLSPILIFILIALLSGMVGPDFTPMLILVSFMLAVASALGINPVKTQGQTDSSVLGFTGPDCKKVDNTHVLNWHQPKVNQEHLISTKNMDSPRRASSSFFSSNLSPETLIIIAIVSAVFRVVKSV